VKDLSKNYLQIAVIFSFIYKFIFETTKSLDTVWTLEGEGGLLSYKLSTYREQRNIWDEEQKKIHFALL
jgi:hypothetical protein